MNVLRRIIRTTLRDRERSETIQPNKSNQLISELKIGRMKEDRIDYERSYPQYVVV